MQGSGQPAASLCSTVIPHHTMGEHFSGQQMGTVGSGTGQQEAPRERLPAQDFTGGMAKVNCEKCNLLFFSQGVFFP